MSARAGMLSRRAFVSGLVGTAVTVANTMQAATRAGGPPLLRTPRSQFIELRPLIETPALRLERIDGKSVGLNEFRGKAVLMNFWATWCPPCRRELPILESLQEATAREPLKIVAVSIDQAERPAVEAFLKRLNITRLRPFLDPLGRIAKHVGAEAPTPFVLWGMPITYIIDPQGRVAGYITGEVEWMSDSARAFLHYCANG